MLFAQCCIALIAVIAVTAAIADIGVMANIATNTTCIRDVTVSLDMTFQSYDFSAVAAFTVIYSKTVVNWQLSLLKNYRNLYGGLLNSCQCCIAVIAFMSVTATAVMVAIVVIVVIAVMAAIGCCCCCGCCCC